MMQGERFVAMVPKQNCRIINRFSFMEIQKLKNHKKLKVTLIK